MAPQYAEHIRVLRYSTQARSKSRSHMDGAFAGSDTIMTALTISRAIEHIGPQDIILCGKKAIDSKNWAI